MTVRYPQGHPGHARGLIDLHLHTAASDGRCAPRELVEHAAKAGVTVMAVTDHDTTAAVAEVRAAALERGVQAISGIEITAVEEGRDLHVLGYLFDPLYQPLGAFLLAQRAARIARVEAIGSRLAALGVPIDVEPLVRQARRESGRSIGRPQVARAMVEAGHVADTREAFECWLGHAGRGYVPRAGPAPEAVIEIIHQAGGIASLAHPGKLDLAARIPSLVEAGLDAVEAFHPDHDASVVNQYIRIARELDLLLTGGSDFHGDPAHGLRPGSVTLPAAEFARLRDARPHAFN
ncbi:MAG: PHP domain-containing protein [Acidobacteria bacterium]|nr:PHP domain-containing protein [Acidobacteriota bacterium]